MNDFPPSNHNDDRDLADGRLFAWRGDEVVLLAEPAGDRWVVARGWLHGDRLVDVRRWSFATPRELAGQIRRLAREATGNTTRAAEAAVAALAWASGQSAPRPGRSGTLGTPDETY